MANDLIDFKMRIANVLKDYCWVSHKNKAIFFVIPKNASTAIRESPLMQDSYRTTFSNLQKTISFEEYTTFTVLREPIERVVSAYYEVIRGNRPGNIYNTVIGKSFISMNTEPEGFIAFLEDIGENGFFDAHLKPQAYFLTDEKGQPVHIDHYLFFDNIVEDYTKLCSHFGAEYKLPDINGFAKGTKKQLLEYIKKDKNILKLLDNLYKDDIMLYDEKNNPTK